MILLKKVLQGKVVLEALQGGSENMKYEFVVCNMCGATGRVDKNGMTDIYFYSFSHKTGYGSVRDGQTIEFNLCEHCLERLNEIMLYDLFGDDSY